jgi:hypothetical protein
MKTILLFIMLAALLIPLGGCYVYDPYYAGYYGSYGYPYYYAYPYRAYRSPYYYRYGYR